MHKSSLDTLEFEISGEAPAVEEPSPSIDIKDITLRGSKGRILRHIINQSVRSLDFLFYTLFVAATASLSYLLLTTYIGRGEWTDRYFFLSIICISELGFWVSHLLVKRLSKSGSVLVLGQVPSLGISAVLAGTIGVWAFVANGLSFWWSSLFVGGLWLYVLARDRFMKHRWVEIVESLAAICVVCIAVYLMLLTTPKDPHHWSFFVGPIRSVIEGGILLWDTPSQYGFLNILTAAAVSKAISVDASVSLAIIMLLLQLSSLALLFYTLRSALGLPTFCAALFAIMVNTMLPGGIEQYHGPFIAPSASALRFGPSFIALFSFTSTSWGQSRKGMVCSATLVAISCLWSAESCLYTLIPIACYLFVSFCSFPSWSFFRSRGCRGFALSVMFLATALVLYYYGVGKRIDLVSFYEYAIVYSTFFGTLPIEPDLWTALFVFAVATTFYVARAQFLRERKLSGQGAMWFAYVCCVSTYFIARSHYCNLQSIFPWLVSAMAAIRFEQSPRFRLVQRGVVFAAGAWGMVYLLSMYTNQNAKMLANRMASQEVYTLPLFEKVPADVAQAARAAAGNGRFTMINNWAVFDTSKELDYVDNSLPIGPPRHFTILDKSRRRWYVIRMMERVPESFLLYPANQGELIQEVFAGSMDRVNLQEIKYPFSGQWKLLQVKRVGS